MESFRKTLGLIRRRLFGNTDDEVRELKRRIETLEEKGDLFHLAPGEEKILAFSMKFC